MRRRPDFVRDGIAPQIKPATTTGEVYPPLRKPALGVRTDVEVFRPFAVGQHVGIRICHTGRSPVMELGFVAQATVRTGNVKHKIIF